MAAHALVGRKPELDQIDGRLTRALASEGSAVVFHGTGGVGKTSLLREAAFRAHGRAMRVLSVTGILTEAPRPYAGLRELLDPLLSEADASSAAARHILLTAAGELEPDQAVELYRVAQAVLSLLTAAAARQPTAVIVDDAQWLDQQSRESLAFVGRRLGADPVVIFFAVRASEEALAWMAGAGLSELAVEPLADDPAAALLDRVAPGLPPALRTRILREAAGNPLGLVELPAVSDRLTESAAPPEQLPLTVRLERNYALTASSLPAAARALLLVAAVDDSPATGEIVAAAAVLTGDGLDTGHFQPAVSAGLLRVDSQWVQFSHPFVRSAISQAATAAAISSPPAPPRGR